MKTKFASCILLFFAMTTSALAIDSTALHPREALIPKSNSNIVLDDGIISVNCEDNNCLYLLSNKRCPAGTTPSVSVAYVASNYTGLSFSRYNMDQRVMDHLL